MLLYWRVRGILLVSLLANTKIGHYFIILFVCIILINFTLEITLEMDKLIFVIA